MGGGRQRQREAQLARRVEDDAQVLDEDLDRGEGREVAARMCGTRLPNIQELPALLEMTSNRVAGSAPARVPRAMASQAAAMWTPARC